MKNWCTVTLFVVVVLCSAVVNAAEQSAEQKPITKVMLARLGWVQSLTKNIAYSNYQDIARDADALSAQTLKAGEAATAPFNKEKNLEISGLAREMAQAAVANDGKAASAKLGSILGACNTCHAKLRDKK